MAKKQKQLHMLTEAIAIPFGLYLIWLSDSLEAPHNMIIKIAGIATLLIDGYLLTTWKR